MFLSFIGPLGGKIITTARSDLEIGEYGDSVEPIESGESGDSGEMV